MNKFKFFYNGTPITKQNFINAVGDNWKNELVDGEFSWGYYRASLIED